MKIKSSNPNRIKASVVIPVKNGGDLLIKVLKKILEQKTSWPFDILVIDSGSRDGSVYRVREIGIKVYEIKPDEFGHGKTRNLGVTLTTGEFIVFVTQDALPTDSYWLANFIAVADKQTDIAGVFGKHKAYCSASPVIKRELEQHFLGFGETSNIVHLENSDRYRQDIGYRQYLHFFSSNNACIKRSVWEKIPLPDVDFAEDQLWAKAIIEAGYAKAYAADACVYHSHEFGVLESYRRAFDESRSFKQHFNYDLAPELKHIRLHLHLLTKRDWRWIAESDEFFSRKIKWFCKTPFLNLAKLLGHYAGNKQSVLPAWITIHFSRDKALQKL